VEREKARNETFTIQKGISGRGGSGRYKTNSLLTYYIFNKIKTVFHPYDKVVLYLVNKRYHSTIDPLNFIRNNENINELELGGTS